MNAVLRQPDSNLVAKFWDKGWDSCVAVQKLAEDARSWEPLERFGR